jgi:hypothetical protein
MILAKVIIFRFKHVLLEKLTFSNSDEDFDEEFYEG